MVTTRKRDGNESCVETAEARPGVYISLLKSQLFRPKIGLRSPAYRGGVAEDEELLSSLEEYDASKSRPRLSKLPCH